ncbi:MAG: DNA primase [Candidatus Gracilibacteria bacterium]|nr:DNA primase [Candidatus Gracilibacteria bacterium]
MGLVEELENSTDIVELVSKYTRLKKAGANYKAVCPFPGHNEKTPSFVVSPVKQLAYCFGCHKGGGALKFVMDIENCEFKDAVQILAQLTGREVEGFDTQKFEVTKNMYSLYKDATNYYKSALKKYPEIQKYLFDRGLKNEDIAKFNFGYADSGVELYNYLKSKGYDDNLIFDSKIFVDLKARKDKFIGRIVFPIQNLRGDFVAFTARVIGEGEPKYLNSPASEYYDKSAILYGLYSAKADITKKDFVIITEGQMDTISLQSAGFFNTVAVSGSALTEKHLTILKRLTHKLYLCFDSDKAGEKATKLALDLIKNKGFEVKIISMPQGKDPDDIIKSGKDFQEYIDSASSPIGYFIKKSNFDLDSLEDKKKLLLELLTIVKSFSDNFEKDYYLKEITKKLNLRESVVYDAFNKVRIESPSQHSSSPHLASPLGERNSSKGFTSEELAIGHILLEPESIDYLKEHIIFSEAIGKDLQSFLENPTTLNSLPLDKKDRYKSISMMLEDEDKLKTNENLGETLEKLVKKININALKSLSEKLKSQMEAGDNDAFAKYSEIVRTAKKFGIK